MDGPKVAEQICLLSIFFINTPGFDIFVCLRSKYLIMKNVSATVYLINN